MTLNRVPVYLQEIRLAAEEALTFVSGLDLDKFRADTKAQKAVAMYLIIIGEASTKLVEKHPEFVHLHPNVPWVNMRGMRNKIAHGYTDLDLEVV